MAQFEDKKEEKKEPLDVVKEGQQKVSGPLTTAEEKSANKVLGANVVEDKSAESVRADMSSTLGHPGAKPAQDAELSDAEREKKEEADKEAIHYVHGNQYRLTKDKKQKIDDLTKELNEVLGDRLLDDLPLSDSYWTKKAELDAYVAGLRR